MVLAMCMCAVSQDPYGLLHRSEGRIQPVRCRKCLTRLRMNHLLATCRIILALAAIVMVLAGGVFVLDHANAAGGHASSGHGDHGAGFAQHAAMHQAGEASCHEEHGAPDCAGSCAAMAGCNLQFIPCDGPTALVKGVTDRIAGQPGLHVEVTIAPATPPPRARD